MYLGISQIFLFGSPRIFEFREKHFVRNGITLSFDTARVRSCLFSCDFRVALFGFFVKAKNLTESQKRV